MRLQKNTSLALFSVLEFAGAPERHISAAEIAARHGISPHHLAKVLAELARAGIVESVRGVGGGYRFAGNARRLTLLDVIQMFEDIAPRSTGPAATPVERALETVLSEIDENAKATFGSITLATMLRLIERRQAAPAPKAAPPLRRRAARARGRVNAEPGSATRRGRRDRRLSPPSTRGRSVPALCRPHS